MTEILEARIAQDSERPATPVFAAPIQHPSAWTVADFRSPADYDLDAAQLRDIAAAMRRINAAGIGLDGLQREHFEVPSLRPVVEKSVASFLRPKAPQREPAPQRKPAPQQQPVRPEDVVIATGRPVLVEDTGIGDETVGKRTGHLD
jgi:hypothetical protein